MKKLTYVTKTALFAAGVAVTGLVSAPPAEAVLIADENGYELHMEVHTVGRLQRFDHDADDKEAAGFDKEELSDGGLQHAIGNLGWRLYYEDFYEVFFDVTIASRVHSDKVWGNQGYILLKQVPEDSLISGANALFDLVDIKAGHFMVDFGDEIHRRSNNADTQRNPLVGNPVVSPHATEAGIEVIHQNERNFGVMLGFGNGVATENYTEDHSLAYRGKIWGGLPDAGLNLSASYYRAEHGASVGRGANLFRTERLGGQYAGIWDDGGAAGQVTIGNGTDLEAWQTDAAWTPHERLALNAFVGGAEDNNVDGKEDWLYYGITGQVYLIPDALYLAARYSVADAQKFAGDSDNDGKVDRIQVGAGAWLMDNLLLKLEYVQQSTSGFSSGTLGDIELNQDPEFNGVIMEFAFSF